MILQDHLLFFVLLGGLWLVSFGWPNSIFEKIWSFGGSRE